MSIVKLRHLLDAFHKPREVLKLCPLIINGLNRLIDIDMFFDGFHFNSPLWLLVWTHRFQQARDMPVISFVKSRKAASSGLRMEHIKSRFGPMFLHPALSARRVPCQETRRGSPALHEWTIRL